MISDYDREHIGDILAGHGDWFSAQLMRIIAKSDPQNLEKLRLGFPEHVRLVEEYLGKGPSFGFFVGKAMDD